jgi:hypothetical protein
MPEVLVGFFEHFGELWKFTPAVALLLLAFWAGYKGMWVWGANARRMIEQLERDRDEWRALALALLKKNGVNLEAYQISPKWTLTKEEDKK